jgi:uncharacterized peroxidase-related enzyme
MSFPLHDETTAPEVARAALAQTRKSFGMIPNLERVMANAPPLLAAYSAAWDLFGETTLTPVEQQVVYQTANFENECNYCVPWHSLLAQKAGADADTVAALREGRRLADPKLEALRHFARQLIHNRGKVSEADLGEFYAAGFTEANALEVVLGRVDKRDSQTPHVLIQDCFLRSSHGSRGFVGCGMGADRAAVAA